MPKCQPNLPPMLLAKETQPDPARPNDTLPDRASALAAELFDAALRDPDYGMTTAEVAYVLDISESLVNRMRSPNARERVSFVQMLRLPPRFHLAMHRVMNKRYGYGRQALLDLLDAVGRLAIQGNE